MATPGGGGAGGSSDTESAQAGKRAIQSAWVPAELGCERMLW